MTLNHHFVVWRDCKSTGGAYGQTHSGTAFSEFMWVLEHRMNHEKLMCRMGALPGWGMGSRHGALPAPHGSMFHNSRVDLLISLWCSSLRSSRQDTPSTVG